MRSGFIVGMVAWGAILAANAPAGASVNFSPKTDYAVGSTPVALASGDLNGDGKPDLAIANNDSGDVSVLYGKGDGTFLDSTASFSVSTAPAAIAVGDFNGDGKLDIVVTDEQDDTVNVLLNQGGNVFGAALTTHTGSSPEAVVVGDFNKDGKLDVATADDFDNTVTILLGQGDGTFMPGNHIPVGMAPVGLVAVDLDGDHNLDLVAANNGGGPDATGTLTVLKGAGDGTFVAQPEIQSTLLDGPAPIVAGDFNGDGKPDIAVGNQGSATSPTLGHTVVVLLGDTSATGFQILSPQLNVGDLPSGIVAADFDGDGKQDLATANNFDDNVSVLTGNGNGTFNSKVDFSIAPPSPDFAAPDALVAADFNGDGKPDLATANEALSIPTNEDIQTVSVLLNTSNVTPPVTCVGDCDGSGEVTVDEIITLVNIALGSADPSACPLGIPSGDSVDITLIISAVNNALGACPQPGQ